jgi:integrase
MAKSRARRKKVQGGTVDRLASGAVRVRVDAGLDPVSKKRHRLTEIIPTGTPDAEAVAEQARIRLLNQVHERRSPRTNATVNQLLERYLTQFNGAESTRKMYRRYVRKHVAPFVGGQRVGDLDADILDSLYAELRRCQEHCSGNRSKVDHRTSREHACDHRCKPHECKPLGPTTIRHIHFVLSGAYRRAVKWKWVPVSPVGDAEPPPAPVPKPTPPGAIDAARIVNRAWRDPDWGTLIWTAMTTGARRGEICALRWSDVDLDPEHGVLWLRRGISRDGSDRWVEGDTKTHQQRRVTLDPETVAVLTEHRERCRARAKALGLPLAEDAFLFSAEPDHSRFLTPGSLTQRYDRLAGRLGIDTTLHKLRHYSATELISAGVDVRTVAGRLGHAGGGTTTLRTYAAWVSEADQRAATNLAGRMPARPPLDPIERAKIEPEAPYEHIAVAVRRNILDGDLAHGAPAPTGRQLATEHDVSPGTAHRALVLLRDWGLITESGTGRRATVIRHESPETAPNADQPAAATDGPGALMLDLEVIRAGEVIRKMRAQTDPDNGAELHQLLLDAVKRLGETEAQIGDYEMNVRRTGDRDVLTTFVAAHRSK